MKVKFSTDKLSVEFHPEGQPELAALTKFPGTTRGFLFHTCPSILPVVFNLVNRLKRKMRSLEVSPEVEEWMNSPFKLSTLPDTFYYHTAPKPFQDIALRYLHTLGSAGLLLDPGMGKTKVVLDYIHLRQFSWSLVVCPLPLAFVWEDEIAIHRPELTSYVVTTTNWEAELPKMRQAKVVIMNYAKAVIFEKALLKVEFQFLHLDEFLIKDPSTDRTKALRKIAANIPYRCGGSGTLINNTPLDAFCPVSYLQPSLVGSSYSAFRDEFTVTKPMRVPGTSQMRPQIVGFRGQAEIRSILDSCCIVMTKDKWLTLPEKKFVDSLLPMQEDQREAYWALTRNKRVDLPSGEVEVDNQLVLLSKLYQIANGFLYISEESEEDSSCELLAEPIKASRVAIKAKDSRRLTHYFKAQPKVDKLKSLLSTTLVDRKTIIWFNMEAEVSLITAALKELGRSFIVIKGGEKDIGGKVRAFNKDPSIKDLVCQAKSVNYGITVMGTKAKDLDTATLEAMPNLDPLVYTQVFYSIGFSAEVFTQQQDRIHRLGQERVCEYYRLFTSSPVEERIREAIDDKIQLRADMLVDVIGTVLSQSDQAEVPTIRST